MYAGHSPCTPSLCAIVVVVVVVVAVVVLTLARINQVRGHGTGSSHSGAEGNTPGKKTHNPRWYTHISQLTQFMPPPATHESEIGSQSILTMMCQVYNGSS